MSDPIMRIDTPQEIERSGGNYDDGVCESAPQCIDPQIEPTKSRSPNIDKLIANRDSFIRSKHTPHAYAAQLGYLRAGKLRDA